MALVLPASSVAEPAKKNLTDVQAKLVVIHNFISKYVQWPGDRAMANVNRLPVCIIGKDDLTILMPLLQRASTQTLQVSVIDNPDIKELPLCHVVYIAISEKKNLTELLKGLAGAPVLTVSSIPNFVDSGGMVGFVEESQIQGAFEKKFVRFEVNTSAISQSKLFIDPDALELAKRVAN